MPFLPSEKYQHDIDGRPPVWRDYNQVDEYLEELIRVFGWDYAKKLLEEDAAMREAAEQAAKVKTRQPPMKEASYADFV